MDVNRKMLFKLLRYFSLALITILASITIIVTGGCDGGGDGDKDYGYIYGYATVEEVVIEVLESFPVQINVVASGYIGNDGCWRIYNITTTKDNNIFYIDIETRKSADPNIPCTLMVEQFEEVIPLDVYGLEAGVYEVDVNGVPGSFELSQDNILQE